VPGPTTGWGETPLGEYDALVALSHDPRIDDRALRLRDGNQSIRTATVQQPFGSFSTVAD